MFEFSLKYISNLNIFHHQQYDFWILKNCQPLPSQLETHLLITSHIFTVHRRRHVVSGNHLTISQTSVSELREDMNEYHLYGLSVVVAATQEKKTTYDVGRQPSCWCSVQVTMYELLALCLSLTLYPKETVTKPQELHVLHVDEAVMIWADYTVSMYKSNIHPTCTYTYMYVYVCAQVTVGTCSYKDLRYLSLVAIDVGTKYFDILHQLRTPKQTHTWIYSFIRAIDLKWYERTCNWDWRQFQGPI